MRASSLVLALVALAGCDGGGASSGEAGNVRDSDVGPGDSVASLDVGDAEAPDTTPVFTGPRTLAETGLYSDFAARTLARDVIPYDVRYQLWADGADKGRYLRIPPGTMVDTSDMDSWSFPVGTKIWKEFRKDGQVLETRYLEKLVAKDGADSWLKVSYAWNAEHTTAEAVPDGIVGALGTTWDIPDQDACRQCHEGVRDVAIGISAIQLASATGKGSLSDFVARGLLSAPPSAEPQVPGAGLVQDALGYLHGNCGHCHNDTSWLASRRTLRLRLRVTDVTPEKTPTYLTAIDAPMTHQWDGGANVGIAPGDPAKSQIYYRINRRGDGYQMPPIGSKVIDASGAATIRAWIVALKP